LILFVFLFVGCSHSKNETVDENHAQTTTNPKSRTEFLMGTVVTIKIYDKNKEDVLDLAFNKIQKLADQITVNDGEAKSEVDKINQNAGIKPVEVSKDIFTLIKVGKTYSDRANGSFDITIGPLSSLWHIGFPDARKPTQEEIRNVLPLINYHSIELNNDKQTVYLQNNGMKLDLGGIAKGYITDKVRDVLVDHGVTSAIIDLGGNVYVLGKNASGNKWTVGIQDPFSPRGQIIGSIQETNKSIVTSGIYERYLKVDGKTYHHILNPQDGYPFNNDIAGVSVITNDSTDGDALSTLLFSKGVKDGLNYAEKIGVDAIFITKDKDVYLTSKLKNNFTLTNKEYNIEN